jgi:hypothetical protein
MTREVAMLKCLISLAMEDVYSQSSLINNIDR